MVINILNPWENGLVPTALDECLLLMIGAVGAGDIVSAISM